MLQLLFHLQDGDSPWLHKAEVGHVGWRGGHEDFGNCVLAVSCDYSKPKQPHLVLPWRQKKKQIGVQITVNIIFIIVFFFLNGTVAFLIVSISCNLLTQNQRKIAILHETTKMFTCVSFKGLIYF